MKINKTRVKAMLAGLMIPALGWAAYANDWADGTATMVTYFPVPYARYNNIYVADKFDLGIGNNFNLNLGESVPQSGSGARSALVLDEEGGMILRNPSGNLTVDTPIYTPTVVIGKDNGNKGDTTLQFNKLTVGTALAPTVSLEVKNLYTDQFLLDDPAGSANNSHDLLSTTFNACSQGFAWKQIRVNGTQKWYLVCCENESCAGSDCYYTDAQRTILRNYCTTQHEGFNIPGTWCDSGGSCSQGCGCQCSGTAVPTQRRGPESSGQTYCEPKCASDYWAGNHTKCNNSEGGHGSWNWDDCKCQCTDGYSLSEGTCVESCSLYAYRANHRGECCERYSGLDTSDTACWNLQWQLAEQSYTCSGYSSADNGCSRENLGDMLDWDYPSGNVVEEGDSCTQLNEEVSRVRYTGNTCPSDSSKCGIVEETLKCQNMYEW